MVVELLKFVHFFEHHNDDDKVDRAHYVLTSNLLIALAALASWRHFQQDAIECVFPKMFPSSLEHVSGLGMQ